MTRTSGKTAAALLAASLTGPIAARADNQMGYRLETAQMAAALPRGGGSLGMKVGSEKEITSGGMTFEILKVEAVGQDSPARQAGLAVGDQVIAIDGRVFPDSKTFAQYVGSVAPGHRIEVDYMPADGGPKQALRVGVTVGEGGRSTTPDKEPSRGLSTGAKVAIGVGAIAVIGCYEAGCFKRLKSGVDAEREKLRVEQTTSQTSAQPQPR